MDADASGEVPRMVCLNFVLAREVIEANEVVEASAAVLVLVSAREIGAEGGGDAAAAAVGGAAEAGGGEGVDGRGGTEGARGG